MRYIKNIALPFFITAMIVIVGVTGDSARADSYGFDENEDLYAVVTEVPDATASNDTPELPPTESKHSDEAVTATPQQEPIPAESPIEDSHTVTTEQPKPPCGGCAANGEYAPKVETALAAMYLVEGTEEYYRAKITLENLASLIDNFDKVIENGDRATAAIIRGKIGHVRENAPDVDISMFAEELARIDGAELPKVKIEQPVETAIDSKQEVTSEAIKSACEGCAPTGKYAPRVETALATMDLAEGSEEFYRVKVTLENLASYLGNFDKAMEDGDLEMAAIIKDKVIYFRETSSDVDLSVFGEDLSRVESAELPEIDFERSIGRRDGAIPEVTVELEESSQLDWGKGGMFEGMDPADEMIEKRDRTSKHFRMPDGSVKAVIAAYGSALHYNDDGQWKTIKRDIFSNNTGNNEDHEYVNSDNSFKSYYSGSSIGGIVTQYAEGNIEEWVAPGMCVFGYQETISNMVFATTSPGIVEDNSIIYHEVYPATDVRLTQTSVGRHLDMIIKDRSGIPIMDDEAVGIAFSEEIIIPDGWNVKVSECNIRDGKIVGFSIFAPDGKEIARYQRPYIYEENPLINPNINPDLPKEEQQLGEWNHKIDTPGYYYLKQDGNTLTVYTIVPKAWLLAEDRTFPIIVDPTYTAYPVSNTCNTGSCSSSAYTYTSLVRGYDIEDGWYDFSVSAVPDGSTVNSVELHMYVYAANWPYWSVDPVSATGWNYTAWCTNGSYNAWWTDIVAEQSSGYYLYQSESSTYTTGWKTHVLGGTVNADCQNALVGAGGYTTNYFSMGHASRDNSTSYYINVHGWNDANRPYIIVDYTAGCTTPGTPTGLWGAGSGTTTANIYWSAGSPAGSATVTYYWNVYTTGGSLITSGNTTGTSAAVGGLTCGTSYQFSVQAYTSCDGSWSGTGWSANPAFSTSACGHCYTCPTYDYGTYTPTTTWAGHSTSFGSSECRIYRLSMTSGRTYSFATCNHDHGEGASGGSASFDTKLYLYNSSCTQVAYNDDCGGGGTQSYINDYACSSTGTYYLKVEGYGGAGGSYNVRWIYVSSCAPPTSVTAYANGGTSASICPGSVTLTEGTYSGGACSGFNWEYRWRIGGSTVRDWSTTETYTPSPASTTTYTLDMRCSGCTGTYTSDNVLVTVYSRYTTAPTLTTPSNGSAVTTSPYNLNWTGNCGNHPSSQYSISINGGGYINRGSSTFYSASLNVGSNTWRVRYYDGCYGGYYYSPTWTVYYTPENYCGTVDHGGNNWTISSSRTVAGDHINVGTFTINGGVTATVDAYPACGSFWVSATTVNIQGTINGNYKGGSGGFGGAGGWSTFDENTDEGWGGGSGAGYDNGGLWTYGTGGNDGDPGGDNCDGCDVIVGAGGAGGGDGGAYGNLGGYGGYGGNGGNVSSGGIDCPSNTACSGSWWLPGDGCGGSFSWDESSSIGSTSIPWDGYMYMGSGGGGAGGGGGGYYAGSDGGTGGIGGGLVMLESTGNMTIAGAINVNGSTGGSGGRGGNAYSTSCAVFWDSHWGAGGGGAGAGGGSGGGIMLWSEGDLNITGSLNAIGGNGGSGGSGGSANGGGGAGVAGGQGGGGSGGRIYIFYDICSGSVSIGGSHSVAGGSGYCNGYNGTYNTYQISGGGTAGLWTGAQDNNWSNACNWDDQSVPTSATAVTIPAGCPNYPQLTAGHFYVNSASGTYQCQSLTIQNGASVSTTTASVDMFVYGNVTVESGGTLSLFDDLDVQSGGNIYVTGGTITSNENSGAYGDLFFRSGSGGYMTSGSITFYDEAHWYDGTTWYASGGTFYCGGTNDLVDIEIEDASVYFYNFRVNDNIDARLYSSTYDLDIRSTLYVNAGGSFHVDGAYTVKTTYDIDVYGIYYAGSGTNYVGDDLYVRAGGSYYNETSTTDIDYWLKVYGRLDTDNGYIRRGFYDGGADSYMRVYNGGTINVESGGELEEYNGYIYVESGGTMSITGGEVEMLGIAAGDYFRNYGTVTMSSGTIDINFTNDNDNGFNNYTGGQMTMTDGYMDLEKTFRQEGGRFDMDGGTCDFSQYIFHINGFASITDMTLGTMNVYGEMPIYEGSFYHSGGTINDYGYYREFDAGGGNYYGSGSAIINFLGTDYFRLMRAGTYFNDVNINGAYNIIIESTQNMDINGDFSIGGGNSFDANGYNMTVAGNWSNSGTFTHDNNTVTFDGTGTSDILGTAKTTFYNVVIVANKIVELEVNIAGDDMAAEEIDVPDGATTGYFDPKTNSVDLSD